jgi:hypothetical protein
MFGCEKKDICEKEYKKREIGEKYIDGLIY